jgi:predicted nuclease with RNAse H fold
MSDSNKKREVFVGIDVAMAKKKRLPICVCVVVNKKLHPLPLRRGFDKPPSGMGNKAALDAQTRASFALAVSNWLKKLETDQNLKISRVAIDAPSSYCDDKKDRRDCEKALDSEGISCFATPTKKQFDQKIKVARSHLSNGGNEAAIPNANQIWMLVGFALFEQLTIDGFSCIETYPQAVAYELQCSGSHKSTKRGYASQLEGAVKATAFLSPNDLQTSLAKMGFGSKDDKLDAFLSAWVASLKEEERKTYGKKTNDSIVVPDINKLNYKNNPPGSMN